MKNLRVAAFRHFIHRRGRCVCIFITAQENKAKQKTSVKSKTTGADSRDKDEIPFRCCCQTGGYKKRKNRMIITKKRIAWFYRSETRLQFLPLVQQDYNTSY